MPLFHSIYKNILLLQVFPKIYKQWPFHGVMWSKFNFKLKQKNQCHFFHRMKFLLQVMHTICGNHHKNPYMGFVLSTITCKKKRQNVYLYRSSMATFSSQSINKSNWMWKKPCQCKKTNERKRKKVLKKKWYLQHSMHQWIAQWPPLKWPRQLFKWPQWKLVESNDHCDDDNDENCKP